MTTLEPEQVQFFSDEEIADARRELRAADDVLEYEQYRRMAVKDMTPEQMARACDIARDRMARTDDVATKAVLVQFIRDVELQASKKYPGRKVAGSLSVGVAGILQGLGLARQGDPVGS